MRHGERYRRVDREACRDGKSTPLAETARSVDLVHLVDPKLALHLVDEIDKRVGVHNVREGFNG